MSADTTDFEIIIQKIDSLRKSFGVLDPVDVEISDDLVHARDFVLNAERRFVQVNERRQPKTP